MKDFTKLEISFITAATTNNGNTINNKPPAVATIDTIYVTELDIIRRNINCHLQIFKYFVLLLPNQYLGLLRMIGVSGLVFAKKIIHFFVTRLKIFEELRPEKLHKNLCK